MHTCMYTCPVLSEHGSKYTSEDTLTILGVYMPQTSIPWRPDLV